MSRNTSIILNKRLEKFISKEVSSGRYSSASEVITAALRLLEIEENKKGNLNRSLAVGEKSGFEKDFDPQTHLKKLYDNL